MRNSLLNVSNTEPGQPLYLESGEWDGLTFRKELIYEGAFLKRNSTTHQPFKIDEKKLSHWETVGNQMIANGVTVPTPVKHTDAPEAGRGKILRYEVDVNQKGKLALYGVTRFRDLEAAKMANSTDVSIFVPEKPVYDGKGNEYIYPIRHVAYTDYPVIPGLEGFEPIAASHGESGFDVFDLELGAVSAFIRDRGTHTTVAQVGGGVAGENAKTRRQNLVAAGLLGGSAVLGGRELYHMGKRFGKVGVAAYKKGGVARVTRAAKTFNKVTNVLPAAKNAGVFSRVARAVGRRIPLIGAASAVGGAVFAGQAITGGIAGAKDHLKRAKALSLGGPGSGPRKEIFNAVENIKRKAAESGHSEFGEAVSNVFHTGISIGEKGALPAATIANLREHSGSLARRAALTGIAGEGLNYLAKRKRNDKENRRGAAYASTFGVHKVVKNALAQDGSKLKAAGLAASILGTAIAGRALMRNKKELSHSLKLGGEGSGPVRGVKRGPYNVDKAVGDFVGKVSSKVASLGTGAVRRLATGKIARYIAKGEAVNYLARKYRGDDGSRRISAYGAPAAVQTTVNRLLAADRYGQESAKYAGVLKKVERLGGIGTPKAKLVVDALKFARLKHAGAVAAAGVTTGLTAWSLNSLLRKSKKQEERKWGAVKKAAVIGATGLGAYAASKQLSFESLRLGGPPSDGGVGSGNYERTGVAGAVDRFRKSSFYKNVRPYTRKAGATIKAIVRNPLTHIAAVGEGFNQVGKRLRGDEDNRRGASYTASTAGRVAVENFKAADRDSRLYNAAKKDVDLNFVTGGKTKAAAIKEGLFNFVTGKATLNGNLVKPTRSKVVAGAAATVAGLVGASLLLKKRKKQELSLGVIVDAVGNHHAKEGGRFVDKPDSEISKRSMRRRLNGLKPKKFHYEEIGTAPPRDSNEAPREYKLRVRKFRSEHKVANKDYYKDFSEEDVKTDSIASTHQAVKHAALTALGAGTAAATTTGAYLAGKNLYTAGKKESDFAGKGAEVAEKYGSRIKAAKETWTKKFDELLEAKRSRTRAKTANKPIEEILEKTRIIDGAKRASDAAEIKFGRAKKGAERLKQFFANPANKKITFKAVKKFLTSPNIRNNLLLVAGASAAAAAATHETKQHFDATKYHLGNVAKKVSAIRNKGLV